MRPRVHRYVAIAVVVGSLVGARLAWAENPRAKLVYSKDASAGSCPDAEALKDNVVQRLGYNPFDSAAEQTVIATLKRDGRGFLGTLSIKLRDGTQRERQPLSSTSSDCSEIAASLALAMSIAIDPHSFTRAGSRPEAPPPPSSASPVAVSNPSEEALPPPPAPARSTPKSEGSRIGWRVGAGPMISVGVLPSVSAGPTVLVGATFGKAAVHLEGRYDFPSSKNTPVGGEVSGSLLLGSLVPCIEPKPVLLCGIASAGALFGRGEDVSHPQADTTSYSAVGARVGVDVALFQPFRGRLQLEGDIPLRPTTLRMAGIESWKTPPVFASLSFVVYGYGPR